MRRLTLILGLLVVVTLSVTAFMIGTLDIYIAVSCAAVADVYVVWLSRRSTKKSGASHSSIAPLMLIATAPAYISALLFVYGYIGSPLEAVSRIILTTGFSIAFFVTTYPLIPAAKFKTLESHLPENPKALPFVSILVPAFNEQAVISRTLSSLVNIKYLRKEIIVIDDGSTDLTKFVALGYKKYGVRVVSKPNGGKAAALNYGLLFARER